MIRREVTTPDGSAAWLLMPQIAHAELAGKLADVWRLAGIPPDLTGDLVTAVHRHDDGWADWDSRPQIDPQSGRPIEFDEMRLDDSLAIWTHSIDLAACSRSIQGYFVAGHFTRLLQRFDSWRGDPAREDLAREFLQRQQLNMATWQAVWQFDCDAALGVGNCQQGADAADRGIAYLQFFDAVSLWLCCAERQESRRIELTGGKGWTFSPTGSKQGCQLVRVQPWPLTVESCELSVSGRLVPVAHYSSTDEMLAAAAQQTMEIRWRLAR